MGINSGLKRASSICCYNATGNGQTVTVGHVVSAEISLAGNGAGAADIDSIGSTATIDAPAEGEWTTLMSVTGKFSGAIIKHSTGAYPVNLAVSGAESAGAGYRLQIVIDGVVASDHKLMQHASGAANYLHGMQSETVLPFECEESMVLRAVRTTTAHAQASSVIQIGKTLSHKQQ